MLPEIAVDIQAVQSISAVPTILETVAAITGFRFVCVARVTEDSWTACAVLDQLDFGLKVGGGLDVTTTLCEEVRETQRTIVIDHVSEDETYKDHHTPKIYGFESYFSVPLLRADGQYFGTLCGLDPLPINVSKPSTLASLSLFAQLISAQLKSESDLAHAREALLEEQEASEFREQFIAVLGHDLRNPLGSILLGMDVLSQHNLDPKSQLVVERVRRSALRIAGLVDDVVDFTRGKMGDGIPIELQKDVPINSLVDHVVSELRGAHPDRRIVVDLPSSLTLTCDSKRVSQLLSNLLKNALTYGSSELPILIVGASQNDLCKLEVINGGVMIPPEKIKNLFKPYWRGNSMENHAGLGLGLFIVEEIARAHGGAVEVSSNNGLTSFSFSIPQNISLSLIRTR